MKKLLLALGSMTALGSSAFAATPVTTDITVDTVWTTAGSPYILEKLIIVKTGATLDIAPGVIVRGQPYAGSTTLFPVGSLMIGKGGKINARGSATLPVVFTTAARDVDNNLIADTHLYDSDGDTAVDDGPYPDRWEVGDLDSDFYDVDPIGAPLSQFDATGTKKNDSLWGGVIFVGSAQTNAFYDVTGDTVPDAGMGIVEGLSGADAVYGGFDDLDDQGTMKYCSIRHGGIGLVDAAEINALTLYAVGRNTTFSNIDIYCTSDDGIEIFGGAVNLDHVSVCYADDDSIDTDQGWRGTIQFGFVFQGAGFGDHGFELDGDDGATGAATTPLFPVTDARLLNFTVVTHSDSTDDALNIDSGFSGIIANSVFVNATSGSGGNGFDFTGITGSEALSSLQQFRDGKLQIRSNTVFGYPAGGYEAIAAAPGLLDIAPPGAGVAFTTTGTITGADIDLALYPRFAPASTGLNNFAVTPSLIGIAETPSGLNPRATIGAPATAYGFVLDNNYIDAPAVFTSYRGAFDRTAVALWTTGWTAMNKRGILVP